MVKLIPFPVSIIAAKKRCYEMEFGPVANLNSIHSNTAKHPTILSLFSKMFDFSYALGDAKSVSMANKFLIFNFRVHPTPYIANFTNFHFNFSPFFPISKNSSKKGNQFVDAPLQWKHRNTRNAVAV